MARKQAKAAISDETRNEALKIARGTQKPGQTKEQTKLIAQGIEKGIAEYKKREKQKARERDKQRKQELKAKQQSEEQPATETHSGKRQQSRLAWWLLIISWALFIAYIITAG